MGYLLLEETGNREEGIKVYKPTVFAVFLYCRRITNNKQLITIIINESEVQY